MAQNLMVPAGFGGGHVPTKLAQVGSGEELGAGIRGGFGIIGYKGKVWSSKFQGEEKVMMRPDGDGPRNSIEVVIVKAATAISKIFYESGFVDGSTAPPDCWSTNGLNPDAAAPKKQSSTCAGCPKNAWGSKVTEAGKQGKACSDSKRLAIVPLEDMKNELMGGAMLLRVPAASLKDIKGYGDQLQSYGFPYFAVATRISFDVNEAFPKFVFGAIRPLTDAEADIVLELRDSPQTNTILNESVVEVHHEPQVAVPASPFEQGQAAPAQVSAPTAAQAQAASPAAHVTAPAAQPVQPVANPPAEQSLVAAPGAPEAEKPKRTRRTKEEMQAAAAALTAARGAAQAPAQPPSHGAQVPAQPAPVTQEGGASPASFDQMLDELLPS